jgi:AcrR family transcriptional regulator
MRSQPFVPQLRQTVCMEIETTNSKIGRPREFDEDAVIEAAMRVFWEKSYEGTSLSDLTEAMHMNRSSIYASFGDKQSLFGLVMDRYAKLQMSYLHDALRQERFQDVVEKALRGTVEFLGNPDYPRGCLSIQGALASSIEAEPVKRAMIAYRKRGEAALKKRVQQAQQSGELDRSINPSDYARYLSTIVNGLGVAAANGVTKAELHRIVDINLQQMGNLSRLGAAIP